MRTRKPAPLDFFIHFPYDNPHMLVLRLQRVGKKHAASYRLAVAEGRSKVQGPPVEDLGSWNPHTKKGTLKPDRVTYWIGKGAQPSVTVHNLLVKEGILKAKTRAVKMKQKVTEKAASEVEAAKA